MILSCQDISKSFITEQILSDVSFHINEHEKAAIVGINGAGKSTLLKIIVGELTQDSGTVTFSKGCTFGYLSQHQNLTTNNTIYDELLTAKAEIIKTEERIRQLELKMKEAEGAELEQLLATYTRLNHEFELNNGYAYKSEVIGVLKGLGFEEADFSKTVSTLSGGQKTRIALGKLLLTAPELIILDEPTNHLDLNSVAWLETYLANYSGAVLIVAHDRYFLDKTVTKVIELYNTKARVYEGNYSAFAEKKSQLRDIELKHYLNQQQEIKHQEEVIEKLKAFNREKSIKRAESREKALDKIERLDKPIVLNDKMRITLEPNTISGNDVLSVKNLKKAFGQNVLFDNLSFEVKRGERIAILGNNGTGKTTLFKIITGSLTADAGEIIFGAKVFVGYYDQEQQVLNPDKTLFEEISDAYPDLNNTKIRNHLAAFLFTEDDVFKLIRDLSGGERGRVSLAKLMLSQANLLILDEPTNHLDITSKEILEDALNSYTGTIIYVSHDRYFINKTATRILDLTNKQLLNYKGDYNYYLEKREQTEALVFGQAAKPAKSNASQQLSDVKSSSNKSEWQQQREEQARIRKQQNDLKRVEEEIESLESENSRLDTLLTDEAVFSNPEKLLEITTEKASVESRLNALYEQWETLQS